VTEQFHHKPTRLYEMSEKSAQLKGYLVIIAFFLFSKIPPSIGQTKCSNVLNKGQYTGTSGGLMQEWRITQP